MAQKPRAVVAGVALTLAAIGCGRAADSGRNCTLIGCGSPISMTVEQPGERPLEACVGDTCSPPGEVLTISDVPLGDSVEVVVRVAGGGDEVARARATPSTSRPNGPHCSPECRAVRLRLTVDDRLVPA